MTTLQAKPSTLAAIKSVLDAQLIELKLQKVTIDENKQRFAPLKIAGLALDKWDEFTVDVVKLQAWARTWREDELIEVALVNDGEPRYSTARTYGDDTCWSHRSGNKHYSGCQHEYRPGMRLRLSHGTSYIQFGLINTEQEGVQPIEMCVVDGVIQPPVMPDKADVKCKRRILVIGGKLKTLSRAHEKWSSAHRNAERGLEKEEERYWAAIAYVNSHSFRDAIQLSQRVREARSMLRYLHERLESPDAELLCAEMATWFDGEARERYRVRYYSQYDEPARRYINYTPKKSWSQHAGDERERRRKRMEQARRSLEWYVLGLFDIFLQRVFGFSHHDVESYNWRLNERLNFQFHRKQIRFHARRQLELESERAEARNEMARLKDEFDGLKREKEELEADVNKAEPQTQGT